MRALDLASSVLASVGPVGLRDAPFFEAAAGLLDALARLEASDVLRCDTLPALAESDAAVFAFKIAMLEETCLRCCGLAEGVGWVTFGLAATS